MNQDSGEIYGTLGDQYILKEDPSVQKDAGEPVVINLPSDDDEKKLGGARAEVTVQTMSSEEKDLMIKSAKLIRYVDLSPLR